MHSLHFSLMMVSMTIVQVASYPVDVHIHNLFTADIYKELMKIRDGNFAICPLSVHSILTLLRLAAQGQTAEELSAALYLPEDRQTVKETFTALISNLHGNSNYTLNSVNKIYVKNAYSIASSFKQLARDVFDVEVDSIDFNNATGVVAEMNKWVADKTRGKLRNLISEKVINKNSAYLLISGVFIEARWEKQFKPSETYKKPFYINGEKQKDIKMMTIVATFNYYDSQQFNAKFLEMPFVGDDMTMTFVLPNEKDGLNILEKNIRSMFTKPNYVLKTVEVEVPKFTILSLVESSSLLKKMGIKRVFNNNTEITEFLEGYQVRVDTLIQSTFLQIQEGGTNVATPLIEPLRSPRPRYGVKFVAHHPFMYYIKFKNIVIAAGRYISP